jgi:hypothetical protein
VFLQASGLSPRNYFLLARSLVDPRRPTVVFLAQGEQLRPVATFEETVFAMHAAQDGTLWCLTEQGTVLELGSEHKRVYALPRPVGNQTQWRGIGEYEGRVLVWGTAALLEFNGDLFVPFSPAPGIEKHECVVAVARAHEELKVLVKGQGAGAVARFDGTHWVPIEEHQVLEEDLVDYDFWQGRELLLGREGHLWTVEPKDGGAPRRLPWNRSAPAFLVPTGSFRCPLGVRAVEGATLVASVGGVLVVQEADPEPLFHAAPNNHDNVKLSRLAAPSGYDAQASVLATFGGHVWLWDRGEFHVLDMTSW